MTYHGYGAFTDKAMRQPSNPVQYKGNAHRAASFDRAQFGNVTNTNPNTDYRREVYTLSAKSWASYLNGGFYRAIYKTLEQLTFGETGLTFNSAYVNKNMTPEQQQDIRAQINTVIKSASKGTRLDAGNQLSRGKIEKSLKLARFNNGGAFAVRVTKDRPYDKWSTTVRILDTWRLTNPIDIKDFQFLKDKSFWFQGIKYSADGEPIKISFISNPNIGLNPAEQSTLKKSDMQEVDWRTESGMPNVIHTFDPARADQLRGFPEASHIIPELKFLDSASVSYVKAKAAQAADVKYIQTNDGDLYSTYEDSNCIFGPGYKQNDANVAVIGPESQIILPDLNFNGADYGQFVDSIIRTATASFNLPFQFVMARFGTANMAVSRTELDQAFRTGTEHQNDHIDQVSSIIDWWILDEAIKRDRLGISSITRARERTYSRPSQWSTDPGRDAKADTERMNQGVSAPTILAARGYDARAEVVKAADFKQWMDDHNVAYRDIGLIDPEEAEEDNENPEGGG